MSATASPNVLPADAIVEQDRQRTLLRVLGVLTLISFLSVPVNAQLPGANLGQHLLFAATGVVFLGLILLLRARRMSYSLAVSLTLGLTFVLLLKRVITLFSGGLFDAPAQSFFMPVYAYYAVLYLMLHLLLSYPLSARIAVGAWLALASITTACSLPYWGAEPPRPLLSATLLFVWMGHGLIVLLVFSAAHRQTRLLHQFAELAEAARATRNALQESESRFHGIFDQAAVGIAMLDSQGRWLEINQRICDITGYHAEELLKLDFQAITHPEDLSKDQTLADQVIRHEIDTYSMEKRYIRKDGSVVWIDLFVSRLSGATPEQDRFVSVIQDISQRKGAEQKLAQLHSELGQRVRARTVELQESNDRWQQRSQLMAAIGEMMSLLTTARDAAETCRIVALSMPRIFPRSEGTMYLRETSGAQAGSFIQAADWGGPVPLTGKFFAELDCWALRRGQIHCVEADEHSLRCTHDATRQQSGAAMCLPLSVEGHIVSLLHLAWPHGQEQAPEQVLLRTLQEQLSLALSNSRLRAQLQTQALTDPLTELGNRRSFESHLNSAYAAARRLHSPLSLLILDVDHFKSFNDRMGHEAGDLVLRQVAACLHRILREDEAAFRYGGEEFVVVLKKANADDAAHCAERIRQEIADLEINDRGHLLPPVTVSIGVASYAECVGKAERLLSDADAALYRAKAAGRNCVKLAA